MYHRVRPMVRLSVARLLARDKMAGKSEHLFPHIFQLWPFEKFESRFVLTT